MTTIRLTNGKTVKADITDYINSDGVQFSVAYGARGTQYVVVDRDFDGPIWAKE